MTSIAHHADYLCEAIARLGAESAFEVLARAKALEATGRRVVHMEIGEPDFDTPEHIKRAGIRAIEHNLTHYSPSAGLPELREVIGAYASSFRGLSPAFARENVVVGAGAKPLIWNLLSAILDPGDELVYADPAYPAYASAASYLQAMPIPVHLLESREWRLDLDELAAKVGPKTKALVINSPHNPTGGVLTREDLEAIAELAHRHDFLVVSDEIYSRNIYGPAFHSISQVEGMCDRTIIVDGFSKAYAMTGWRLGYLIAPKEIAQTVTLFNNNTFSCVPAFVQQAGIAALTGDDAPVRQMNETFRERRDVLVAGLNGLPGITCTLPEGAFYAFPNVSRITRDDKHLATWLLEHAGVGCLGGSSFGRGGSGYLRFSYATSIDGIRWALEQLREALPRYPAA
jgi:aspartate/methionine/tyrosine aminotransferase